MRSLINIFGRLTVVVVLALVLTSTRLSAVDPPAAAKQPPTAEAEPAGKPKPEKVRPKGKPGKPSAVPLRPEHESAARAFAKEHDPELGELLDKLQATRPQQYQRAVRELYNTSARLSQLKDRDATRYGLEMKLWKCRSKSQLLVARATMQPEPTPEQAAEIKTALREQFAANLELMRHDRRVAAERVAKLDQSIARAEERREKSVEEQYEQLTRAMDARRAKKAGKVKPNTN